MCLNLQASMAPATEPLVSASPPCKKIKTHGYRHISVLTNPLWNNIGPDKPKLVLKLGIFSYLSNLTFVLGAKRNASQHMIFEKRDN